MAEAHGGNREQESIDLQLKSLVSQINTSTDDFDMDVADAPTLPIPTVAKNMSSSDVAVSSLLSFSQGPATGQGAGTNPFYNDGGFKQEGSVSQFGILPSRPQDKIPQSNGLAASLEAQQNVGQSNGFPQSASQPNPTQQGSDQSMDQAANSFAFKSEPALPTAFPGDDGDKIQIKKENLDTLAQVGLKPMEESEIERRNIAVAGFAALNGQDPIVRKSIRQPKKKMIQDYVEFSNSLGMEEGEENKGGVQDEVAVENEDEPVKKKGKRGRKPKSGKGKKAAKAKLDVDEVYRSDDDEEKEKAEGEEGQEDDLNRDLMKVRMMKCDKCDKHFLDRSKLRMHQRAAHKPKRVMNEDTDYHCSECGKIFKRREHWRRHKEVHEVSRPHICITCGKAFKRLEHLKRHQSVHFTDKPFPCDECGKAFTRRDHLAKHKLLHESGGLIKPFAHKKSRKRKRDESEEKDSTEATNVKGSRKRKITVQLKARKVESPVREEDYLDDKEAQSSDFLSSDDEPLGSPKKRSKSSKGNSKKVQVDIEEAERQKNQDTDKNEDFVKSDSEFEAKSGNDVNEEGKIQDASENMTENVPESVNMENQQENVALREENVTISAENEHENVAVSTENDPKNLNEEDEQQSMNIVQEQPKLYENDDSANVTMGSSIQSVNTQDNLQCMSVVSDQGNVISDSGIENMNLQNVGQNVITQGNVNFGNVGQNVITQENVNFENVGQNVITQENVNFENVGQNVITQENVNVGTVGQNVITQETGQTINTPDYMPNENIVAIDVNLPFKN
ncbi:hypothetical protein FSP39_010546 [Pinctada imbricata]|uniref:C2H2-type domain-containing protein n=1 Tax=Pinctada imbricata TaxID=66713 RepID=A0AA88YDV9_PINIB|nr:hypothetical protein FSP39_010546 [Pinctada imbricata]